MTSTIVAATWWESVKGPLAEVGVNSIVGLVVVFAALIFISFVISLLKYVGKLEKKPENNDDTVTSAPASNELSVDNYELTAIITAAISEYEEARGNSFKNGMVVRSVRKIS